MIAGHEDLQDMASLSRPTVKEKAAEDVSAQYAPPDAQGTKPHCWIDSTGPWEAVVVLLP
jgi:hypothetical protein